MVRRDKGAEREIARDRVARLVERADAAALAGQGARADRYVELAWRIKTTYQLRRSGVESRLCRRCHKYLGPGTARVRLREGRRVTTCLACGHVRRRAVRPSQRGT